MKPKVATVNVQHAAAQSKSGVASRIWASTTVCTDVSKCICSTDIPGNHAASKDSPKLPSSQPADTCKSEVQLKQNPELSVLQPIPESNVQAKTTLFAILENAPTPKKLQQQPPKRDSLQVYLEVQRSVICIQKNTRGFLVRLFYQT